jgi:AraC family transcriptional regulator
MPTHPLATLASQPPIEPLETTPQYVVLSSYPLGWQGLNAWRKQAPPHALALPPLTQHQVVIQLNAGPRLLQEHDGHRSAGGWHRGDILIVRAGQPSQWQMAGAVDNLHIDVDSSFLQRVALEVGAMNPDRVELRDVFQGRDPEIVAIGHKLLRELTTASLGGRLYAESVAQQLAIHLLRTYCTQSPRPHHSKGGLSRAKLRCALEYLQTHLDEGASLTELAQLLGLSRYHVVKMFKQSTGVTPHQYLLDCRLHHAEGLLTNPQLSIAEIAVRVGFATPSHFTYHFHKRTGTTPQAYRQAQGPHRAHRA